MSSPENIRVAAAGLDHPEGVAVDERGLIWAVGEAGQVYVIDPTTDRADILCDIGTAGLGIAFDADGSAHVCTRDNTIVRVRASGDFEVWADAADGEPLDTPNYPAFHPDGRLLVSGSGGYPERTGVVYAFDPDGTGTVFHHGPFAYANGLAVDPTRRWLYVVQTGADNVVRIPLDEPNGAMVDVVPEGALLPMPDGVAFDGHGAAYVTSYAGDAIERIETDGGVRLFACDERAILFNRPTNCAFAGPTGTLYVANLGGTHLTAIEGTPPGLALPPQ